MGRPDSDLPRRSYLHRLVAAGGLGALAACLDAPGSDDGGAGTDALDREHAPRGEPSTRPDRQHAWNDVLETDDDGNHLAPEHHVLLALELTVAPADDAVAGFGAGFREQVETAFLDMPPMTVTDGE